VVANSALQETLIVENTPDDLAGEQVFTFSSTIFEHYFGICCFQKISGSQKPICSVYVFFFFFFLTVYVLVFGIPKTRTLTNVYHGCFTLGSISY
jgi:hypothetical protein